MKRLLPIIATALLAASPGVSAGVFKCVDAEGKQSYQQQPCPKTSAESRVKTVAGEWLRLRTMPLSKNQNGAMVDYHLNTAGIKTQGAFKVATVRMIVRIPGVDLDSTPRIGYVRYDCTKRKIAGPESTADGFGQNWYDSYEIYQEATLYPFADAEVIAKVCAQDPR